MDKMHKKLQQLFGNLERFNCGGGIWGGYSRSEVTKESDLDIFLFSNSRESCSVAEDIVKKWWNTNGTGNYLDYSSCHTNLEDHALVNGTNYHTVYFFRPQNKSYLVEIKKAKEAIINNSTLRGREVLNVLFNQYNLSNSLSENDARWPKFSSCGTNAWVRLVQSAQLLYPELILKSPREVLLYISSRYGCDESAVLGYEKSFFLRQRFECSKIDSQKRAIQKEMIDCFPEETYIQILQGFLFDVFAWIEGFCVEINHFALPTINKLTRQKDIPLPTNCEIFLDNPIVRTILAFLQSDTEELKLLSTSCGNDWWVASNLVANPSTSPEVLEYLCFPPFVVSDINWKTIRLYVAKHKNATLRILMRILSTPNLREQDYKAALCNLQGKNGNMEAR